MSPDDLVDAGQRALDCAKAAGASAADVMVSRSTEFEVKVADGAILTLSQATSRGLGLRVFVDGKVGFCTTHDLGREALEAASERAVAFARQATVDPHNDLTAGAAICRADAGEDLQLYDPQVAALSVDEKVRWAHAIEAVARATDPAIAAFQDSGVASEERASALLTSAGTCHQRLATNITLWCSPVAKRDDALQTELWYDTRTHLADLQSCVAVGQEAARRALRMLGAKPSKTQRVPVIFEPQMAAGLLAAMLGALDGDAVYKKASFLADRLGTQIGASELTLVDDPHLARSPGSARFDGEGVPTRRKKLLDRGQLATFLYDGYTARKAGVASTANARRSCLTLPRIGAFNVYAEPGPHEPDAIVANTARGLLLTRGLGRGLNNVSGEYSRGANGLWIERGEIAHPVQEVTIAGDYINMLRSIDMIGSDLTMRGSTGAPTLRIADMTVSGSI